MLSVMIRFPKVMDVCRFLQSRSYEFAPDASDVDCFILDRLGKDWDEFLIFPTKYLKVPGRQGPVEQA